MPILLVVTIHNHSVPTSYADSIIILLIGIRYHFLSLTHSLKVGVVHRHQKLRREQDANEVLLHAQQIQRFLHTTQQVKHFH